MTCNQVLEILDMILDCEASEAEKDKFFKHIDKCTDCLDHYELDKLFKEFVQKHDGKKCCTDDMILKIKEKVNKTSA